MGYTVEPIEGQAYEGRQIGYVVMRDGERVFECSTGGTGACWNIRQNAEDDEPYLPTIDVHVCDLDDLIGALTALRDSEANRLHVERWS